MKKITTPLKPYLVSLSLLTAFVVSSGFADRYFEIARHLDTFASLYRQLNNHYVDQVNPGALMQEGIGAMLSSLDPYTEYIPESELEDFKMNYVSKQYAGIGASVFNNKAGKVIISEPYEGFSAQKADIRAGDEILFINGVSVAGKNSTGTTDLLKGQKGTSLSIVIKRDGESKPIEKTLTREVITFKNVPYYGLINDSTGYIKLDKFLENAAQEVRDAFITLKAKHRIKGLVLDLRGNGGGIVQESVNIVNLFVEKGQPIVTQKGRVSDRDVTYKAVFTPVDAKIPLVVLVDKGSASASEIVSGAIQDLDRGTIIGQRTFGKGLVQQTISLPYNSLLKVTVAKYYTPSGRCIQAMDYSHRNSDGSVIQISDSLMHEFRTRHGRLVYDGSGIYPDVTTPEISYSNITNSLINKMLHFDFATYYRNTHPVLPAPRQYKMTDADYDQFLKFIANRDYSYTTRSEKHLQDLKKQAQKEKNFEHIKKEFEALESRLQENKKDDLIAYKEEIKEVLEAEIVARYYFQSGKVEASFKDDAEIKEALKVLNNKKLYADILKGDGSYKIIGKPKSLAYVKSNNSSGSEN
ncbi:peptidase S41 [Adhaeribacter aerolatus]|uniref:Peptidase S41 n=1 Tax=Adhaeribacter aerolatus TaxID=670289 RepID=A0A512B514_9BACT|nr:S41 family peptidase [Adhaeribacter aerolatus]GEO07073.1 peptidase S41 [Adhaeribacter aerolatus]